MFELNSYLLSKMGWINYSQTRGIGLSISIQKVYTLFEEDDLVRFFFIKKEKSLCYIIKELSEDEKQKSKNNYKFILVNFKYKKPKFQVTEFNSNHELLKKILEEEACVESYIRQIRINKLLYK
jgi:hypothetical protein